MNAKSLLPRLCGFNCPTQEPRSTFPLRLKPDVILTIEGGDGASATREVIATWILPPQRCAKAEAPVAAVPVSCGWGSVITCRMDGWPSVLGWRNATLDERSDNEFSWSPPTSDPNEGEWMCLDLAV